MKHVTIFAAVVIAICTVSTGAIGQNVYRCGNTYSQKPCTDGVQVDVQDARTPAQKAESQAAVRREANTANAMEKARLQEEAQLRASETKTVKKSRDKKKTSSPAASDIPASGSGVPQLDAKPHKAPAKKKKEPEYFTARGAAAEKPKAGASKSQ